MNKKVSMLIASLLMSATLVAGCGSSPVEQIKDETGLNESQSQQVVDALKSVGVDEFDGVDALNKDKGMFYVKSEKYGRVYFVFVDGAVREIDSEQFVPLYLGSKKLRDAANGYLTAEDIAEFQVAAEHAIKEQLKAPDTANFSDMKVQRFDDNVKIVGKVSAQNSFGAQLTKSFYVLIKFDSKQVVNADIN